MKVYKLTGQNLRTRNEFQWIIGEERTALGNNTNNLCTSGWLHFYTDPLLALFLNPVHARIINPRIFEAETTDGIILMDKGLKGGSTKLTLIKELNLSVTLTNRIAFGILCTKEVYGDIKWNFWAAQWLLALDRSYNAAYAAADAADANAAYAAAAAYAADAANAAYAVNAAIYAANAAIYAANAAKVANIMSFDLKSLAKQAITIQ